MSQLKFYAAGINVSEGSEAMEVRRAHAHCVLSLGLQAEVVSELGFAYGLFREAANEFDAIGDEEWHVESLVKLGEVESERGDLLHADDLWRLASSVEGPNTPGFWAAHANAEKHCRAMRT